MQTLEWRIFTIIPATCSSCCDFLHSIRRNIMALKAAFIFVAPDCDPQQHRAVIPSPVVELHVVGVKNYREAAEAAQLSRPA